MARMPITPDGETPRSDDRTTIAVQNGLAKGSAATQAFSPIDLPTSPLAEELARGVETAKGYVRQAGVPEKEFDPSAFDVWGAYFRSENTVGSLLTSETIANSIFPTPNSPRVTTEDLMKKIETDKLGPYQEYFLGVDTLADYEATKKQLHREIEDKKIMAAASGLTGTAAALASGIIDLPSLLPGAIGWKLGGQGVGALKAAAGVGAGAVLGSSVSEAALQASQVDRSWGQSAASVGGSVILGGFLGAGLHTLAHRSLGPAVIRGAELRAEKAVADLADDAQGMRSAGAAQVNAYERLRGEVDDQRSLSSYGALESLKALGNIKGFIGKNARIPMLDLENSQSPAAFDALNKLIFRPGITRANAAGEVDGPSPVVAFVRDYREHVTKIAEDSDIEYKANRSAFKDYADFDTQVARALMRPTDPAHPAIAKVAAEHRKVYTQIVDELIEAKVLPASVKERYGDNYFPMIFDADGVRADEAGFKSMISEGFSKQFRAEAEDALRQKLGREAQNEGVKERVVGVVGKAGKVDDKGLPVINPKTGKQEQTKVVIKEGTQLERERIAKEQYDLRREYLAENRRLTVETHTKETDDLIAKINGIYDENRNGIVAEFTDALDRAARTTETPAQRAQLARRLNAEQKRRLDATDAERRRAVDEVRNLRRADLKSKVDPIDKDLAEAKTVRDDLVLLAKGQAKAQLDEALVSVREGLEGPLRFTREGKVSDALIKQEADALADRWYKSTTGWNKYTLDHELDGFTEFLKKRRTPVEHSKLLEAGFVRGNAFSIIEDYVRMAGTDAAVARTFKRKVKEVGPDGKPTKESDLVDIGDIRLRAVKEDIIADYDALREAQLSSPEFKAKEKALEDKYVKLAEKTGSADEKAKLAETFQEELNQVKGEVEKKLANQRDRDIENVDAILDAIRGTPKADSSQSFRNAAETVSAVNYVRLLGGTVISSFTDPVKIAIATGFGNMAQGAMLAYQQTFKSGWKSANAAEKGLSRAGAAMAELHLSARLAQMADVSNPHRVDSPSVNFMRKASQVFSKASGIAYWNGFWKQVSENATTAYIGQLAHKGFDQLSKSEKAWLSSLRINAEGLALIKEAHEGQIGGKWYDDFPMLKHEDWPDKQAAMMVRHAVGEELNNHVITPQGYDRMSFATTPTGRVLWQFRQHMVSNQMRFVARQVQLASLDQDRAMATAVGFGGLVVAGATIDFLKQVTGQMSPVGNLDRSKSPLERQTEEWTKTPGLALYNALDRSDTLGLLMEGSNVMDKLVGFGPKSALTFFDDKTKLKEASRFTSRSPIDALAGPTLGLGNDVLNAGKALGKIATGSKLSRGDYRSMERLVPGQNIPYIQWMGNSVERSVGDLYSWPNPK